MVPPVASVICSAPANAIRFCSTLMAARSPGAAAVRASTEKLEGPTRPRAAVK